jgi:hypothetical protein
MCASADSWGSSHSTCERREHNEKEKDEREREQENRRTKKKERKKESEQKREATWRYKKLGGSSYTALREANGSMCVFYLSVVLSCSVCGGSWYSRTAY